MISTVSEVLLGVYLKVILVGVGGHGSYHLGVGIIGHTNWVMGSNRVLRFIPGANHSLLYVINSTLSLIVWLFSVFDIVSLCLQERLLSGATTLWIDGAMIPKPHHQMLPPIEGKAHNS